jgi:glutathione peroxidase-family protein
VDKKGNVIDRFAPATKPEALEKDILRLMKDAQ